MAWQEPKETGANVTDTTMAEKANETAGPDVVDDEPGTNVALVSTDLEEYKDLIPGLVEMLKLKGIAYDLSSVRGNDQARKDRARLKTTRVLVEKRCAEKKRDLKASVAERINKLESEADRFVDLVNGLYDPIDQAIVADDDRRQREKAEREAAEQARTDAHRASILDISSVAVRAAGASSDDVQKKIELITRLEIGPEYEEFQALAVNAKADVLLRLADLLSIAKSNEAAAEEARLNREELERLKREDVERREREAEAQKLRDVEAAAQRKREDDERAVQAKAELARRQQGAEAQRLVDKIRNLQSGAITASADQMLDVVTRIEAVSIGESLGDFAGVVERAKDDALHDVHALQKAAVQREADKRRQQQAEDQLREVREAQLKSEADGREINAMKQFAVRAKALGNDALQIEILLAEIENWQIEGRFGPLQLMAEMVKASTEAELKVMLAAARASQPVQVEQQVEAVVESALITVLADPVHGALTDAADELDDISGFNPVANLILAAKQVVNAATRTKARKGEVGPWNVPNEEMAALSAAVAMAKEGKL